jgi:flagellar protein FliO/FliZ
MSDLFGIDGLYGMAAFAGVLCLAVLLAGSRIRRWLKHRARGQELGQPASRLAILESAVLDAQRRLVLIACDDVEHLIMIGGPADLVVETDVTRARAGSQFAAEREAVRQKSAAGDTATPKVEPAHVGDLKPDSRDSESKPTEPKLQGKPIDAQVRGGGATRPALAAVPGPAKSAAGKNGPAPVAAAVVPPPGPTPPTGLDPAGATAARSATVEDLPRRTETQVPSRPGAELKPVDPGDSAKPKQQSADVQFGRRDPLAPVSAAAASASAPTDLTAADAGREGATLSETAAKPGGLAGRPAVLPAAATPWHEADSVENEIIKALSTESRPPPEAGGSRPAQREAAPAVRATNPATTLGDLADRLEEALAREVQSAGPRSGRLDLDLDAFGFDREKPGSEPAGEKPKPAQTPAPELRAKPEQRPAAERKPKSEAAKVIPAAPEPEGRREARAHIERQDEAPVISLNARRREPVDPLEDEMARLLGELTGDTSRR